ncbi:MULTISPECIES: amidase [Dietzia]|uniref:amidase n=1 Tax=Dietzia TaxID=37914 RepID=UPI000785265D|nr:MULTISPECIES: amidase [Dietzia]MCT2059821.1 amidase [Dietzia cinnamea]MCT2121968.1 amidase [Dietzia cinnamea]MCT2146093.1 amidase [Dietzia cinnamea]MCT2305412.1 amidase [Dietzia cinnamea]
MKRIDVVEMSIGELLDELDAGRVTSVDLVCAYLNRIAYYDRTGQCLHAIALLNPDCLEDAAASDRRRRAGEAGRLEGIPFTVKDSYKVAGMTVASGSPALAGLVADEDAASVEQLRDAGAVLLGKTNMPPMAAGGIQPGVYDYARSPYNPQFLTAAYGSGSSNGSGTATAASMCAFGMAEETVSSGRSPASNNSLVAYTPSRGVLSIRGNWPLRPTCDVVVPHTRSVPDLLALLDVLAVRDPIQSGDFWRQQSVVDLPDPEEVLQKPVARPRPDRLDGMRIGVPRMFIGKDPTPLDPPVITPAVRLLWEQAAEDLRGLGAEVQEVDFPVVSNYEEDRIGARGLAARGLVPDTWRALEGGTVTAIALDEFLRENGDSALQSWADVDGDTVFPTEDAPVAVWITRARGGFDWQRLAELVKQGLPDSYDDVPGIDHLLRGLENARRVDFEEWMTANGLDFVVFPAAGDVGRDDLFTRPESLENATRNGIVYSTGNRVIRHLGIPTVTVPMGFMAISQMPVGLTFAGAAYSDDRLLDYAGAYERVSSRREPAFLTPTLPSNQIDVEDGWRVDVEMPSYSVTVERGSSSWDVRVEFAEQAASISVWADGHILRPVIDEPGVYRGVVSLARERISDEIMIVVKAGKVSADMHFQPLPASPNN